MHPVINLAGQRFERLSVIERAANDSRGEACWRCQCLCGNSTTVSSSNLRKGLIRSCGCLRVEDCRDRFATHCHVGTPEHGCWQNIQARCYRPTCKQYPTHGGRGITMDERWRHDFEAFLADVGYRPSPRHRLMRRDQNDDFTPDNCEWRLPAGVRTKGHL